MSSSITILFCWVLMLAVSMGSAAAEQRDTGFKVTVFAGGLDRQDTVVSAGLPDTLEPGAYQLKSPDVETRMAQVDADGRLWFITGELAADASQTYTLHEPLDPSAPAARALLDEANGTLNLHAGKGEVLQFQHAGHQLPEALDERYRRGGYLHPVRSPAGVVLTDHLNPDQQAHHYGIWSAWPNTQFEDRAPDFWNVFRDSGRVDLERMGPHWSGPVHAGFRSTHRFTDLSADEPMTALNEQWEVRVYNLPDAAGIHVFDLVVTQTANTGHPLELPEHRYGGVGFRGHADWTADPDSTTFLTSEGLGREGHATRARWCHIGGHSAGQLAGIAILGHPENFRFPQPMRIHPQQAFFNFAPTQLGDMRIEPGAPLVQKLRFVTYDGEADPERIERLWQDYAYPPSVTITLESSPAQSQESR